MVQNGFSGLEEYKQYATDTWLSYEEEKFGKKHNISNWNIDLTLYIFFLIG